MINSFPYRKEIRLSVSLDICNPIGNFYKLLAIQIFLWGCGVTWFNLLGLGPEAPGSNQSMLVHNC